MKKAYRCHVCDSPSKVGCDCKKYARKKTESLVEAHGVSRVKKAALSIRKFTKIFNNLCKKCKADVVKNPKLSFSEYCGSCQRNIEKVRL